VSTNNGASWSQSNNILSNNTVSVISGTGTNIYAGTYAGGIYLSTDNGTSWSLLNNLYSIYSLYSDAYYIYAGTGYGIYVSRDHGVTWYWAKTSYGRINSILNNNGYIYVGIFNEGVWRCLVSDLVDVKADNPHSPSSYILEQNYPNPFNPSTLIKYSLPIESNVKITVYNSVGQIVKELINNFQTSGEHEIIFNAVNISTGVYFYSIIANSVDGKLNFRNTKKMIFLK
jgi:hypothetical protein